jgi:hypothetical protein
VTNAIPFTTRGGHGWLLDVDPRNRRDVRLRFGGGGIREQTVAVNVRLSGVEARRLSAALLKAAEAAR